MRLSKFVTYCAWMGASREGVLKEMMLFLWWPRTVTARCRQGLWERGPFLKCRQFLPFENRQSRRKSLADSRRGGNLYLLSMLCLLFCFNSVAQDVSEESGWELSIANGLLLFKREKFVQSQVSGENDHIPDLKRQQNSQGQDIEGDIIEEHWFMPAVDTEFRSEVSGIVARSTVIQTFKNPTDDWLHGTYQFPLPEDAAVDILKMRIGKREIIGEIQRKQEARKRFAQAKRTGRRASLVEQQKPNMFTTNLANIGPGEEIEIEIQFQQRARFIEGEFRLRFPTTFIPRAMIPGVEDENDGAAIDGDGSIFSSPFSADIILNAGSELAYIDSPHYPLLSEQVSGGSSEFTYQLLLETPQPGVRDLEINWRYLETAPQVLHYREASKDGEYGLVMIMPGEAQQAPDTSREVTFVIDTSSSMAGESIRQAKSALQLAVQSLDIKDRFNILEFNSEAYSIWDTPQLASDTNKSRALSFIQKLQARGGTDIFAALQLSLESQSNSDSSLLQQLVFVTDGAIGYEEQLLAEIEAQLGEARLFTVGIGSAPNSYFMVEAASVGRGSYTHISDIAQVSTRISALLQQLSSPSLIDLKVDFGMEVEMFPARIPDLYHGEPLVLSYLAPQAISSLHVEGSRGNEQWRQSLTLDYWQEHQGVAKHWAQDKIRDLSKQKRLIPAGWKEDQDAIIQRITQVALEHQLVSPYTSLIAVEKYAARAPTSDRASQAQRLQNEVLMAAMPNTAAGSRQAFVLALLALVVAALTSVLSWFNGLNGGQFLSEKVKVQDPTGVKGGFHVSQ